MSSPIRFLKRLFGKTQNQAVETEEVSAVPVTVNVPDRPNFLARSREAKYLIGQVVKHRMFPFRGVIFDVDPVFSNSDEWYESIPEEVRPHKDQPYYHLFAENDRTHYVAYVSEQNLLPDDSETPVSHPDIANMFDYGGDGYVLKDTMAN
ncbi:MAG: heat shock protein HspQ [Pseudomonadota bacterium]